MKYIFLITLAAFCAASFISNTAVGQQHKSSGGMSLKQAGVLKLPGR